MDYNELERIAERIALRSLSILSENRKQEFADKIQVTKSEIIEAFDLATFKDITGRLGLLPIRKNGGKNGKVYYSAKKVLELTEKWYHD